MTEPIISVPVDQVSRLRQLWNAGLSALECGEEIGLARKASLVREAVLRAIESNAPRTPAYPSKKAKLERASRPTAPSRSNLPARYSAKECAAKEPALQSDGIDGAPDVIDLEIPLEQRKTLLQLTEKTCHWPVGDPRSPDFFFCGGKVASGPYCLYHGRVAYAAPTNRSRGERAA